MRVVTSSQMRQVEENSLAYDLTYTRLMENAGSAAAAYIRRTFRVEGLNCMVFCGTGNNGGDGFVVARKLYENGANVVVVLVDGPPVSKDAAGMFATVEMMEIPVFDLATDTEKLSGCMGQADIVIDAMYGTGFHGKLSGNAKVAAGLIADAIAAVVSLDVPSGVECDTAAADRAAIRADFTVVFDTLKPVHVIPAGLEHCGTVELVTIGIPEEAHMGVGSVFSETSVDIVLSTLPKREPDDHKGTFGTLLAVCGSVQYRGAAALAVLGALRAGAGICRVVSVEPVCAALAAKLYEPIYTPLPMNKSGGIDGSAAVNPIRNAMASATAILFGCGLGDTTDTQELLKFVLKEAKVPIIIDADGINALSRNINVLQEANVPVILTPHPGEMAKLVGTDVGVIQKNRIGVALEFAAEHGVTLVLKGNATLIAAPDGRLLFNRTGGPGLAKGGSGDILAGMIGAFCARGILPRDAAACGVYLHGLAGERCAARCSEYGMLPSELLEDLCDIFLSLQR